MRKGVLLVGHSHIKVLEFGSSGLYTKDKVSVVPSFLLRQVSLYLFFVLRSLEIIAGT